MHQCPMSIQMIKTFYIFDILGLLWGMHGGSYQRQCCRGLWAAGGDVGQWLPSGHWIKHSERTNQASNHPSHSGQHHHRYLCVVYEIPVSFQVCNILFYFSSSMFCTQEVLMLGSSFLQDSCRWFHGGAPVSNTLTMKLTLTWLKRLMLS